MLQKLKHKRKFRTTVIIIKFWKCSWGICSSQNNHSFGYYKQASKWYSFFSFYIFKHLKKKIIKQFWCLDRFYIGNSDNFWMSNFNNTGPKSIKVEKLRQRLEDRSQLLRVGSRNVLKVHWGGGGRCSGETVDLWPPCNTKYSGVLSTQVEEKEWREKHQRFSQGPASLLLKYYLMVLHLGPVLIG